MKRIKTGEVERARKRDRELGMERKDTRRNEGGRKLMRTMPPGHWVLAQMGCEQAARLAPPLVGLMPAARQRGGPEEREAGQRGRQTSSLALSNPWALRGNSLGWGL